jgi:hypothetical protein
MWVIALAAVLLLAASQQSDQQPPHPQQPESQTKAPLKPYKLTPEQIAQAAQKYEPTRLAVVQINDLAGSIHSEADARAFIDAAIDQFTGKDHQSWIQRWATRGIRHKVARAEYEAATETQHLIPEQRVVDVWNEYVREIDAPGETLITVAELHNLRDALLTTSQARWRNGGTAQQFWSIPNVYAVDADGKAANGCRAVEALKLLHDMFNSFPQVRMTRARVEKGVLLSDLEKQRAQDGTLKPVLSSAQLSLLRTRNPLPEAEYRYIEAHGERDYRHLMERLFAELFPAE